MIINLEDELERRRIKSEHDKSVCDQQDKISDEAEYAKELHLKIKHVLGVSVLVRPGERVSLNFGYERIYFGINGCGNLLATWNPVDKANEANGNRLTREIRTLDEHGAWVKLTLEKVASKKELLETMTIYELEKTGEWLK